MTIELHTLRCETCTYNPHTDTEQVFCEKYEFLIISKDTQNIISVVGCSSHSSVEGQRDDHVKSIVKYCRKIGHKKTFRFDWAGGLSALKGKISSVELQHKLR
jgi:hypothetical protein